ncbi:MAG: HD domain-containing protein [candidate division KSB1 bacterium]|nr:HD domain-containing protein [candidate division KSB1 bacterium]MDQ7063742.1 HD domain-containing protein [candidate division KSB1 bacterium]
MITLQDVKKNPNVDAYIVVSDRNLELLGYTEHGRRHVGLVAKRAREILTALKYDERTVELAAIAAYLHDIGNAINRHEHASSGAVLAHVLLSQMGMDAREIADIVAAIGSHDEGGCEPVNSLSAALILADKSDVHRSRVRNPDMIKFDIHDRVNYAVERSHIHVNNDLRLITLDLHIDTKISPIAEYFEIFMERMLYCKRAAKLLRCEFSLVINSNKML